MLTQLSRIANWVWQYIVNWYYYFENIIIIIVDIFDYW